MLNMTWFDDFDKAINAVHEHYNWFQLKTPKGSMSATELFYIYTFIRKHQPTVVFESGVATGRSTVILAEIMRPIGQVIAARFDYPEDRCTLQPFAGDYPNLEIIEGRGEDVIKRVAKDNRLIAVVDGPKPIGYLSGRPGWVELMDELIRFPALQCIFQHDIEDKRNKAKFLAYHQSNMAGHFSCEFIDEDFLYKYRLYGMDDESKNYLPNVGVMERL